MESAASQDRLAAMEERLRFLEDHVRLLDDQAALYRLIASWGPAADIPDGKAASWFWDQDAVLEWEDTRVEGASGVQEKIDSEGQHALVSNGCAHVQGLPLLRIDGDRATATNYGRVYVHTGDAEPSADRYGDAYEIRRVSVNRWEFRRTEVGWRVTRRTTHVLDGGPVARELLSRAVAAEGRDR
jgi:SnoaL-like domain